MRRRLLLGSCLLAVACETTEPTPAALQLTIYSPAETDEIHDLDPLILLGEATAEDLGLVPDDSIWWTQDAELLGTGRRVTTRATGGAHTIALHARYGAREDSVTRGIAVTSDGLGRLLWTVPLDMSTGDVLAFDLRETLFATDRLGGVAVAIGLDGSERWQAELGTAYQQVAPAVGPDGSLYYAFWGGLAGSPGVPAGGVLALNSDGSRRWVFRPAEHAPANNGNYHVHGGVALDAAGNVYIGTEEWDAPLYAIRSDGSLRWRLGTKSGPYSSFWSYATLVADSLVTSIRRTDSLVVAGATDGVKRWTGDLGNSSYCLVAPAVGTDGTLYVPGYGMSGLFSGGIRAYNTDGTVRWSRALPVPPWTGSPVVGADRIYFAATNGGVLVLSTDGDSVAAWGPAPTGRFHDGIALAAHGVVYVVVDSMLVSYDAEGATRFAVVIPHRLSTSCASGQGGPVIGPDGTVYVRASDLGVMAFRDTVGPATDAPWPTLQGDFTRRGRRATDR